MVSLVVEINEVKILRHYTSIQIFALTLKGNAFDESACLRKPTMWFPNRSDTNRPVQAQKQARSLKFRI